METGLLHLHSLLRWVVLALLLITIFKAFQGVSSKRKFTPGDRKLSLFTLIATHLQLVLGLVIFVVKKYPAAFQHMKLVMKVPFLRFFVVEHTIMMLIAIAFITIGYSKAKRSQTDEQKFKTLAIFFTIGLIIILAAIPWPFRAVGVGRGWF